MNSAKTPAKLTLNTRLLTAAEFQQLSNVPPASEWFENILNENTKRAYRNAIKDFMRFVGIERPEEFRLVTRAHVLAWRRDLGDRIVGAVTKKHMDGATIRHRLAIKVWRFADAPRLMQSLHRKSPPPEWLVFIPHAQVGSDLDEVIIRQTGSSGVVRYETSTGEVVCTGSLG